MKTPFLLLLFSLFLSCSRKAIPTTQQEPTKTETKKTLSKADQKRQLMEQVAVGKTIPNGGIKDMDGNLVRMAEFSNQLLVINFWATWCGACLEGMPKYHELANKYNDPNKVSFIAISIDQDFDQWRLWVESNLWDDTNYWLGQTTEEPLYGFVYREVDLPTGLVIGAGVPRYVIVAPDGTILDVEGRPSRPQFEKQLKKYITQYVKD